MFLVFPTILVEPVYQPLHNFVKEYLYYYLTKLDIGKDLFMMLDRLFFKMVDVVIVIVNKMGKYIFKRSDLPLLSKS